MLKIAHRGASGYAPENTILAIKKGFELGANAVEFDVHLCKTGELVVIHDETTERTANVKGVVSKMTLSELKKLNVGAGEKIPTLEEVLDVCKNKTAFIEIKAVKTGIKTAKIVDEYVNKKGFNNNKLIIASFNLDELSKIKKQYPKVLIGATFEDYDFKLDQAIKQAKELRAYSLNLSMKCINKESVKAIKDEGMKIFVWTARSKQHVQYLKKFDIDGIMCDYPDLLND